MITALKELEMNQLNVQTRVATVEDIELIYGFLLQKAEFDRYSNKLEATPEKLRQTLFCQPPLATVLFAEVDGIAVGFALFGYSYSSFLAQLTLWLGDLFVQSHSRGQGVGTALVLHLAHIAEKTDCGRIEWTVAVNNSLGISFYEKQGARILETKLCRVNRALIAQILGK